LRYYTLLRIYIKQGEGVSNADFSIKERLSKADWSRPVETNTSPLLRSISPRQPFVEFLRIRDVIIVGRDRVDELFSSLYASAAFVSQEAPLSWTVNAFLTVLAEPFQQIVQKIDSEFTEVEHEH